MGDYIDVTYADSYISVNPAVKTTWSGYSDTVKNEWIDYAEQQVNNIEWIGEKTVSTQTTEFPRSMLSDTANYTRYKVVDQSILDRIEANEDSIFDDLKIALCESIIGWIRTLSFQKLQSMQEKGVNIESFSAGSVSFNFKDQGSGPPLPKKAWELMFYMSRFYWYSYEANKLTRI